MPTYYVDAVDGNNGNLGTSEGSGNAWQTISHALTQVVAGDKVWVKNSGTYNELATISVAGVAQNIIIFEGYGDTTGDGVQVTIDAQNTRANCIGTSLGASPAYNLWRNFRCVNATGDGMLLGTSDAYRFDNCTFNDNGGHGANFDANTSFINCVALNNTNAGFYSTGTGSNARFIGCIAGDNGQWGFRTNGSQTAIVYRCVVYGVPNNASHPGIDAGIVIACSVYGEGGANAKAIDLANTLGVAIDNIAVSANIGIETTTLVHSYACIANNLLNDNTTDISTDPNSTFVYGNVVDAPAFTDAAGGDLTLQAASGAIGTGILPGNR